MGGSGSGGGDDLLQLLEQTPPQELDRQYAALHSIFAAGVHELARQVSINCIERGELLASVWASTEALKARLLLRKEADAAAAREELARLREEHAAAEAELQARAPAAACGPTARASPRRAAYHPDTPVTLTTPIAPMTPATAISPRLTATPRPPPAGHGGSQAAAAREAGGARPHAPLVGSAAAALPHLGRGLSGRRACCGLCSSLEARLFCFPTPRQALTRARRSWCSW